MTKTEWMNWLEKAWDEAQQREWVGLTDEEIKAIVHSTVEEVSVSESVLFRCVARAIEAKLKEKNQ